MNDVDLLISLQSSGGNSNALELLWASGPEFHKFRGVEIFQHRNLFI